MWHTNASLESSSCVPGREIYHPSTQPCAIPISGCNTNPAKKMLPVHSSTIRRSIQTQRFDVTYQVPGCGPPTSSCVPGREIYHPSTHPCAIPISGYNTNPAKKKLPAHSSTIRRSIQTQRFDVIYQVPGCGTPTHL